MLSINGHKTGIQKDNVSKIKKRKVHISSLHPSKNINTSPIKKSPMLTLPLNTRLLSSQNYSPFLSWMTKGELPKDCHLLITRRASILIFIIIIITGTILSIVRTYVSHLLGTYVTILCNWFILWQNALYLYLGRFKMCLILQEIVFQD